MRFTPDTTRSGDVCKLFHDHTNHLYTLSLLLTADHHAAEQCFVRGLEDCLEGTSVFREWAQSWARRSVINNAIRMIAPSQNNAATPTETREREEPISNACALSSAIIQLPPFERFVYVISVLEKYADRECSILLNCTVAEIVHARTRAFQQLATSLARSGQLYKGCFP